MSGGFIGVDLFFVLSGYLITSIIYAEMQTGRFSILEFYRRRVIRILPALLVMLFLVMLAGAFLLLPNELRSLGRSAAAAAGFASNIYFWKVTDYFGDAAISTILLHTWSLGIEEQFYIFLPIGMMIVQKLVPRAMRPIIVIGSLLSFAASAYLIADGKALAAFYLLPSRAWELGLGGMIAVGAYPRLGSSAVRNVLSAVGLTSIIVGYFIITEESPFPAPWALMPCLGAFLLIAYGKGTTPSKWVLENPVFSYLGKISYSLYLWHWPIITLYRLYFGNTLHLGATLLLIALSVGAGALSYRYVETPFRKLRGASPRPTVAFGAAAIVATIVGGVAIAANVNVLRQFDPKVEHVIAYNDYNDTAAYKEQFRAGTCFAARDGRDKLAPSCLTLSDTKPNIVVLGDSHAAQIWKAISLRFQDSNVIQATATSCRPTLHTKGTAVCEGVVNRVLGEMADSGRVHTIVLAGRWQEKDLANLDETVRMLRGKNVRVVVVGPVVEYDGNFPSLLARAMMTSNDPSSVQTLRVTARKTMSDEMGVMVRAAGGDYVPVYDLECPDGKCPIFDDAGGPFHFDYGHLTLPASKQLVAKFPQL